MSKLFDNFSIGEAVQQALKEAGEPEEVWQQQSQRVIFGNSRNGFQR